MHAEADILEDAGVNRDLMYRLMVANHERGRPRASSAAGAASPVLPASSPRLPALSPSPSQAQTPAQARSPARSPVATATSPATTATSSLLAGFKPSSMFAGVFSRSLFRGRRTSAPVVAPPAATSAAAAGPVARLPSPAPAGAVPVSGPYLDGGVVVSPEHAQHQPWTRRTLGGPSLQPSTVSLRLGSLPVVVEPGAQVGRDVGGSLDAEAAPEGSGVPDRCLVQSPVALPAVTEDVADATAEAESVQPAGHRRLLQELASMPSSGSSDAPRGPGSALAGAARAVPSNLSSSGVTSHFFSTPQLLSTRSTGPVSLERSLLSKSRVVGPTTGVDGTTRPPAAVPGRLGAVAPSPRPVVPYRRNPAYLAVDAALESPEGREGWGAAAPIWAAVDSTEVSTEVAGGRLPVPVPVSGEAAGADAPSAPDPTQVQAPRQGMDPAGSPVPTPHRLSPALLALGSAEQESQGAVASLRRTGPLAPKGDNVVEVAPMVAAYLQLDVPPAGSFSTAQGAVTGAPLTSSEVGVAAAPGVAGPQQQPALVGTLLANPGPAPHSRSHPLALAAPASANSAPDGGGTDGGGGDGDPGGSVFVLLPVSELPALRTDAALPSPSTPATGFLSADTGLAPTPGPAPVPAPAGAISLAAAPSPSTRRPASSLVSSASVVSVIKPRK
jgi:hypothetical protein